MKSKYSTYFEKFASIVSLVLINLWVLSCSEDIKNSSQLSEFEGKLRGGLQSGEYSLTFDDGPSEHTSRVLDILAKNKWKATFFVNGYKVLKRPELLERMLDEGHLVANHTHTHANLTAISDEKILEEVLIAHKIIEPYVDNNAFFFRAPWGFWKLRLGKLLNDAGLDFYVGHIDWDIGDALTERYAADWACWYKDEVEVDDCGHRYLNEMRDKDSGIILMHDVTSKTAQMLEYMAPKFIDKGYTFSRLDKIKKYKDKLSTMID